ncbi:MAG TPA: tol-pal system protein YbgF [Burkholderiaceae bacterium]|jgi:tol-pal system protein YbgF
MLAARPAQSGRFAPLAGIFLALVCLLSFPARAALFEDDEARRAILELRGRLKALEDANAQLQDQNRSMNQSVEPLRRSVLDLNNQIDTLHAEMAKLRGDNEQLARDLADTQRKVTDQSDSINSRLRPLEPQAVTVDGKQFQVSPDESRQYDAAMGMVRRGDFSQAAETLQSFLRRYPASGYADSVTFWLGNAQYGNRQYKDAIATFKGLLSARPDYARAPEAQLAVANCQIELKDVKLAKRTLQDLIKNFPGTDAAQAAKERLAALR